MYTMAHLLALLLGLVGFTVAQSNSTNSTNTFTNPVVPGNAADPWIIRHSDGLYYMMYTKFTNLSILRSASLTDWADAEEKTAFVPPVSDSKCFKFCYI
jgi:beta-xylosidase